MFPQKDLAEELVLRSLRVSPANVKDSLVVKSLAFVNSCIQKVNLFIRYFSCKFNCTVMPVWKSNEFSYLLPLSYHNEKISSMNLFYSRGLVLLRFSISVLTAVQR